jgi:hypothetical protein
MLLRPLSLLAVQVVEALLVGFGGAGQAVDESERVGESRGGLLFEVAVRGGQRLDTLGDGIHAFREPVEPFIRGHARSISRFRLSQTAPPACFRL